MNGTDPAPATLTRPNGSYTAYTYDNLFRPKSVANKKADGTVIVANAFTHNNAHKKTSEAVTNGDALSLAPGTDTFAYNAVNQIASSSTGTYSYDADGNMTGWSSSGVSYSATYDAENRMVSVSGGGHSAAFTYGFDGFLVKQVVDQTETRFVNGMFPSPGGRGLGRGSLVLQERNSSNEVTRSYVWDGVSPGGIGGLLEMTAGGAHYNYLYDGKGNVRALIDESQNVAASYAYDEFGVFVAEGGTLDQPYRFSTKRYYADFGISKYQLRDYMPHLGRWAERDPIGEAGGLNLYGFVGNSAINWVDPWGLIAETPVDVGLVALDVVEFQNDPTLLNGLIVLGDGVATLTPFAPAVIGLAIRGGDDLFDAAKAARYQREYRVLSKATTEVHHMLPKEFVDYFKDRGLNIEEFTFSMPKEYHRLKSGPGIHCGDFEKSWNGNWAQWIENHPTATANEILQHLEKMKKEFGFYG